MRDGVRRTSQKCFFIRFFKELVDFRQGDPHVQFRKFALRYSPSCFHSASTGARSEIWKQTIGSGTTMPKLTKRVVEAAEIRATEYFIWDDEIRGLGVRILPSGRKGYLVQYRAGRRSRRIGLGSTTVVACEQARNRAIAIIAAARNGEDPAAKRDADRTAITIKQLSERFDMEHISVRLKPSTAKEYRRNLSRFILPALGRLTVTGVTRADVAKFHYDLRHIPYQANRCLEVISKMFNLAELWGLRPDGSNPRRHIKKYPEDKRERFLSAAELRRIGAVLREMEGEGIELPSAILAARLLILTGCRLNEIMTLKWEHVNLASRQLSLPDSKTGAKAVYLGLPAIELLNAKERVAGNPWVITGTLEGQRLSDLQPFWQRVRARAGLKTFAFTTCATRSPQPRWSWGKDYR